MERYWRLTQLGRNKSGSEYASESSDPILSYMRGLGKNKTVSTEELSSVINESPGRTVSSLRKYARLGLVEVVSSL